MARVSSKDVDKTKCFKCNEKYDPEWRIPKILPCAHTICQQCVKIFWGLAGFNYFSYEPYFACPKCQRFVTKKDNLETDFMALEQANQVICGECGREESEVDCHVCKECSYERFNVEISNSDSFPVNFDADRVSLCSTCAIRSHIRKEHTVSDFLPVRLENRLTQDLRDLKFGRAKMNIQNFSLESNLQNTLSMMEEIDKKLCVQLVDILRDCKSSHNYDKMRSYVNSELDGMKSIVRRVEKNVESLNESLQEKLEMIKKKIVETAPQEMKLLIISNEKKENDGSEKEKKDVEESDVIEKEEIVQEESNENKENNENTESHIATEIVG